MFEEVEDNAPGLSDLPTQQRGEPEWKKILRENFEAWLSEQDEPPTEPGPDVDGTPDLFTFHADLAALGTEFRKSNRRSAEALKQWSDLTGGLQSEISKLRERLDVAPAPAHEKIPDRSHWLGLVELADRIERLRQAFTREPGPLWFGRDRSWRDTWHRQHEALDILAGHLSEILSSAAITRIDALDLPFDPQSMTAIETTPCGDQPANRVLAEIRPGYRHGGDILRLAEVRIAVAAPTGS